MGRAEGPSAPGSERARTGGKTPGARAALVRPRSLAGVAQAATWTLLAGASMWVHNFWILPGRWRAPVSGWLVAFVLVLVSVPIFKRSTILGRPAQMRGVGPGAALVLGFVGLAAVGFVVSVLLSGMIFLLQHHVFGFAENPGLVWGWPSLLARTEVGPQPWAFFLGVVIEEVLFRGIWMGMLQRSGWSPWAANLGQAVLFAVWHSLLTGLFQPQMVVGGLALGAVWMRRRSLAEAIGFHAGWNLGDTLAQLALWVHLGVMSPSAIRTAVGSIFS